VLRNLPRRISWNSNNLSGNVKIEFSRNGGQTYETLIAATANDGEEFVIITGKITKQARLRISSLSNVSVSDSSVANFSLR
jgi:hypothetical protein